MKYLLLTMVSLWSIMGFASQESARGLEQFTKSTATQAETLQAEMEAAANQDHIGHYDRRALSYMGDASSELWEAHSVFRQSYRAYFRGSRTQGDQLFEEGCSVLTFAKLSMANASMNASKGLLLRIFPPRCSRLAGAIERAYRQYGCR